MVTYGCKGMEDAVAALVEHILALEAVADSVRTAKGFQL